MDLNTYKEADLCDDEKNSVIKEKVFIATVHKAKGLEFENVIVYGTIDDIYPFFANRNDPEEFDQYCLQPAIRRRGIVKEQCHYIDPEFKTTMPNFWVIDKGCVENELF